jgi:hypothetical protein
MYRILYERALSQLSPSEAELIRVSNEFDKINYPDESDAVEAVNEKDDDEFGMQRESLHSMVGILNHENMELKVRLERVQSAHDSQLELKQGEIDCLRSALSNELSDKGRIDQEKSREIEQLRRRLLQDEEKRNEWRVSCAGEVSAAQIRFENELARQNCIMQGRNDELSCEIKRLHEIVRVLEDEKTDALRKMCQRDAERGAGLNSRSNESSSFMAKKSEK